MKREDIEKAAVNYDSRIVAFRAFKAGADWRINSVWHEASEIPDANTLILCITKEGEYFLYGISQYYYEETVKIRNVIKWAYIEDLLSNKNKYETSKSKN